MDIKVTSCSTSKPIYLAIVTDSYGNTAYTDTSGFLLITPGTESEYYGTVVEISASGFITNEFTLASYAENDFCLQPAQSSGGSVSGSSGGLY